MSTKTPTRVFSTPPSCPLDFPAANPTRLSRRSSFDGGASWPAPPSLRRFQPASPRKSPSRVRDGDKSRLISARVAQGAVRQRGGAGGGAPPPKSVEGVPSKYRSGGWGPVEEREIDAPDQRAPPFDHKNVFRPRGRWDGTPHAVESVPASGGVPHGPSPLAVPHGRRASPLPNRPPSPSPLLTILFRANSSTEIPSPRINLPPLS